MGEDSVVPSVASARRVLSVALLSLASACNVQVYRMSVPPALESESQRFDVHGWLGPFSHKLRFGSYVAERASIGFQRASHSGATLIDGKREVTEARQSGHFQMETAGAGRIDASCHMQRRTTLMRVQEFKLIGLRTEEKVETAEQLETYRCKFTRAEAPPFELSLEFGGEGRATVDGVDIVIDAVSHYDSARVHTVDAREGYLLKEDGRHVAAVDFNAGSSVTLRNDLAPPRRDEVAAIAVGLLMLGKMH